MLTRGCGRSSKTIPTVGEEGSKMMVRKGGRGGSMTMPIME